MSAKSIYRNYLKTVYPTQKQKEQKMEKIKRALEIKFTNTVNCDRTHIEWAIAKLLDQGEKPTKKAIREYLKTQIGLFGTDEATLIGQNYFEDDKHPDLEKYLKKYNLTEEA